MNKQKWDIFFSILGLILFFFLGLFSGLYASPAYQNKLISQEKSRDHLVNQAESKEKKKDDVMSFTRWRASMNFDYDDYILNDVDQMSAEEIIKHFEESEEINPNHYSLSYSDFAGENRVNHRSDQLYIAASSTKILVAMIYIDLIEEGELDWDSAITYSQSSYQAGNGDITARSGSQSSFPLKEVMEEMIVHSDNTATMMLKNYYRDHYGNYEERVQKVLGLTDEDISTYDLLYNRMTTHYLQEALKKIVEEKYQRLLEFMQKADQPFFLSYYFTEGMATKFGNLDEYQHDVGIYFIEDQPQYFICIMTEWLTREQADAFMGGINLQLSVKEQYADYLSQFSEVEIEQAKEFSKRKEKEEK